MIEVGSWVFFLFFFLSFFLYFPLNLEKRVVGFNEGFFT